MEPETRTTCAHKNSIANKRRLVQIAPVFPFNKFNINQYILKTSNHLK